MKVSVLIPLFNKAPYVKEAIDSVLHGTFGDFEIVVVDDRSTDGGADVVRGIEDPRLHLVELPENRGPAGAANAGLEVCTGEYIVRLDADDVNMPDRIARQVAYMDAHPEVGASGGALDLFGAQKEKWSFPLRSASIYGTLAGSPNSTPRPTPSTWAT
jgi:glycosyltransferase involved in cell wall biosynthesis